MSAQSFAEKGVQKCPFCPCGNMCTCFASRNVRALKPVSNREREHPARLHVCCRAEEWADNGETEGRQRDVSVAER